jgi:hypothetical protein
VGVRFKHLSFDVYARHGECFLFVSIDWCHDPMLEFSVSLKDSAIEFSPPRNEPDLALLLPPTARIEEDGDNVLLDPIPLHSFFNAVSFSRWLGNRCRVPEADSFLIYVVHDVLKSLLRFPVKSGKRRWEHSFGMFDELRLPLQQTGLFGNFETSFEVIAGHMQSEWRQRPYRWREATWHEHGLDAPPARSAWEFPTPSLGLAIRLNPTLSNLFAIEHIKGLFVKAYSDAIHHEYAEFFDKLDEITYRYKFVDPDKLLGDTNKDVASLARDVAVTYKDKHLVIETPIGAMRPPEIAPDATTRICVPFWLLLTIYADSTGIIFPIPSQPDDSPNMAFIERVKNSFYRGVEKLLDQVPSTGRHWKEKKAEIVEHLLETLPIVDGKYEKVRAALVADALADVTCNLCGSNVSRHFLCSPEKDLGWSTSHYTDWHQGNIESVCVLCAISNFKVPRRLDGAYSLMKQKKLVYLSTTTPNISGYQVRFDDATRKSVLPFFDAPIQPKLVISSLESLVTLNLIGALFLHASIHAACVEEKGTRELWLKPIVGTNPFAFFGEIGKRQSKREIVALLKAMHRALNRQCILVDPMMQVDIEIPFNSLTCIMGNTRGKHYELKYKPLLVGNKTGVLPLVCDGFHLVDVATLEAINQVQTLVRTLRGKGVSDSMKISALASSPADLVDVMTSIGGCNIETVLQQLQGLGNGEEPLVYLTRLGNLVHKYPLVTELWR